MEALKKYEVHAINRSLGQVLTTENELCSITGWHNSDDDYVEPEFATFVTFQFPDGKFGYAILSDFNFQNSNH